MSRIVQFFRELRRRKVFRVAILYLIVAWALIEAGSVVLPELFLPDWSVRLLIVLAAFGFPFALMLAWVFDITPQGVRRTDSDEPDGALAAGPSDRPANRARAGAPDGTRSLAVLPFTNIGGDEQDEYFSDGLAEDLLNALSRIDGLHVVARSSAFAFRGGEQDVRAIADALGVTHVLEGSVRRAEKRLRINVRLVSAQDGYQLWSDTYDRELGDIFRIQDEISRSVFEAFHGRFGAREPEIEHGTQDIEAYHLYLMGRHQFHKRTPEALARAIEYFEQAIALDPEFALPYSGLSDAWALTSNSGEGYGNLPVEEAIAHAAPLVDRALALAPRLPEAHASLGLLRRLEGDLPGSEVALRHAIELNQSYPLARVWLALTLADQGRLNDARAEFRKAHDVDPLSIIVITNLGFDRLKFGKPEEARALFQRVMDIDPAFPVAYSGMANVERYSGNPEGAIEWWRRATEVSPRRAYYRAMLGLHLIELGELEAGAREVARAAALSPEEPGVARSQIALLVAREDYAGLVAYTEERLQARRDLEFLANAGLAQVFAGDFGVARARYEEAGKGVEDFVFRSVVWSWRYPHSLLFAHALQQSGARDRARALRTSASQALARVSAEGLANPEIDYLKAVIAAQEGRVDEAAEALERALRSGWQHGWWARRDPMLASLRESGRLDALLAGRAA